MKQLLLFLLLGAAGLWAQNQNLGNVTVNNLQINGQCSGNCPAGNVSSSGPSFNNNAALFGAGTFTAKIDPLITTNTSGLLSAAGFNSSGNATFLGLTLTSLNSATPQCIHATLGVLSLTGTDCNTGGTGGNVTGSSLTNNKLAIGSGGSAITIDSGLSTNGAGTLSAAAGIFSGNASVGGNLSVTGSGIAGAFTAKSYNTVLEADQYCTTPGTLDQTCFNNAFAACPANGCAIHLKAGSWVPTAPMVWGHNGGRIFGDGMGATHISPPAGYTQDVMQVNVGGVTRYTVDISGLNFSPQAVLTAGTCLHVELLETSHISDVNTFHCYDGFSALSTDVLQFSHVVAAANAHNGFIVDSLATVPSYTTVFDGTTIAIGNGANGFVYASSTATSDTEALIFMPGAGAISNSGAGLLMTAAAGARVSNLWVTNGEFDNNVQGQIINTVPSCFANCGIYIDSSVFFFGSGPTGTGPMIDLGTAHGSRVSNNIINGTWLDAVLDNGTYNVITNNVFNGAQASGKYAIHIKAGSVGSQVQGNRIMQDSVPLPLNGIIVDAGATFAFIQQNDFIGINGGTPLTNNAGNSVKTDVDRTFSTLGSAMNSSVLYCSDCTIASACAGGGTGAIAKRLNGTWVCN